jgi:hypothetical protein
MGRISERSNPGETAWSTRRPGFGCRISIGGIEPIHHGADVISRWRNFNGRGKGVAEEVTDLARRWPARGVMSRITIGDETDMQSQDFAKFVASQQEPSEEEVNGERVDWAGLRDAWIRELDSLYDRVLNYLKEFIDARSIRYELTEITLTEEDIGTYRANLMELYIGKQHISLEPIGTRLIGCKGRVDVVGSGGRSHLMLLSKEAYSPADLISVSVGTSTSDSLPITVTSKEASGWDWKIVPRALPRRFVDLNRETFFDLLKEISGG